jgi:hypothetical protein
MTGPFLINDSDKKITELSDNSMALREEFKATIQEAADDTRYGINRFSSYDFDVEFGEKNIVTPTMGDIFRTLLNTESNTNGEKSASTFRVSYTGDENFYFYGAIESGEKDLFVCVVQPGSTEVREKYKSVQKDKVPSKIRDWKNWCWWELKSQQEGAAPEKDIADDIFSKYKKKYGELSEVPFSDEEASAIRDRIDHLQKEIEQELSQLREENQELGERIQKLEAVIFELREEVGFRTEKSLAASAGEKFAHRFAESSGATAGKLAVWLTAILLGDIADFQVIDSVQGYLKS